MIIPHHHHKLDHCLSHRAAESLHANLLKLGLLLRSTFLSNRLLHLYSRLRSPASALLLFQETPSANKNIFTHNILLSSLSKSGSVDSALQLFAQMPQRDSVSWNSLVSCYAHAGLLSDASAALRRMRELGFRPTGFTFSIAASAVLTTASQAKQLHASAVRNGFDLSNTVVANSFISMYGRVGLPGYSCRVLRSTSNPDVVSWNSLITVLGNAGLVDRALECLMEMRREGFLLDAFSVSAAASACADGGDVVKGEQLLAYCFKMGFLSNPIVSSAVIDMYSKCGRLGDSVQLFREMERWDSAVCNSMVSAYVGGGLVTEAFRLFLQAARAGVRPTEFTFASILSLSSCFLLTEQGTQVHCYVVKFGLEDDTIVASALVDTYMKLGTVESGLRIFGEMDTKDLISCNTVIFGLAQNGQTMAALRIFKHMLANGPQPDRITFVAVLSACCNEGLVSEGKSIFASMEKYGIERNIEHYACMVDMMGKAGMLGEALDMVQTMPHKPTAVVWHSLLEACRIHGDLRFTEIVAKEVMKSDPQFPLPYTMLAQIYGIRGKWESVAHVWKTMNERSVKKVGGCSWIGIKSRVFSFKDNGILHFGGESTYSVLNLLLYEMEIEGYAAEEDAGFENG